MNTILNMRMSELPHSTKVNLRTRTLIRNLLLISPALLLGVVTLLSSIEASRIVLLASSGIFLAAFTVPLILVLRWAREEDREEEKLPSLW
jgi:hypothetical protein